MTPAEAIRQMRAVLAGGGLDRWELRDLLWTMYEVRQWGVDPIIEIKLRRWQRRAALRAGN